jgi:AMP-binding enzyme
MRRTTSFIISLFTRFKSRRRSLDPKSPRNLDFVELSSATRDELLANYRIHWAGPLATMEDGRRLPQARRARLPRASRSCCWHCCCAQRARFSGCRLALLPPNEHDYLELVCLCLARSDRCSGEHPPFANGNRTRHYASPRGLIRHSSLPAPTVKLSWELVLDQELLEVQSKSHPEPIYNPEAIFALVYTSGTTGHPKGVAVSHANILASIDHLNYWMPYRESSVHLHAAPIFHIIDFPFMRDPDGYFYILDRLKDMIVTGGNQAALS